MGAYSPTKNYIFKTGSEDIDAGLVDNSTCRVYVQNPTCSWSFVGHGHIWQDMLSEQNTTLERSHGNMDQINDLEVLYDSRILSIGTVKGMHLF